MVGRLKAGAVATATLGAMLKEHYPYGNWSGRVIEQVRSSLLSIMEDPGRHGISTARLDDFDRAPIFALKGGGSIDARNLEILDADATARCLLLDRNVSGVDFRPSLLNADANHPGPRLAAHFEPKDSDGPPYSILRRLGYQILGPHKAIDTITMPRPDAGKNHTGRLDRIEPQRVRNHRRCHQPVVHSRNAVHSPPAAAVQV